MNIENLRKEKERIVNELKYKTNIATLENELERIENAILIFEENNLTKVNQIVMTNIKWDAPKSCGLPTRVVVDINLGNVDLLDDISDYADTISDWLSNTYGFCHFGFKITLK